MNKHIIINNKDNVAVALDDLTKGEIINLNSGSIKILDDISLGNKFATTDIYAGENIIKYGYLIGRAAKSISKGALVHSDNLKTSLSIDNSYEYQYRPNTVDIIKSDRDYFLGYRRSDNKVGIRNDIWIIPMVGCVNSVCRNIEVKAQALKKQYIDDIVSFPHQFGCSQLGGDHSSFQKFLAGLAHNPNAAGILFVALGCENNTIDSFIKVLGDYDEDRIKFITCQAAGDEVSAGLKEIEGFIERISKLKRTRESVDKLIIGLKCGGSDGLSGITANPVTGAFSDILVSQGGTVILTEIPEMFGAEETLMNRCRDQGVFDSLVNMIKGYKDYYVSHNQPVYENPSPGNKEGGITTLEEKSLGCVLKGGHSIINSVADYCDYKKIAKGLNIMSSPGNDLIASSALAAAGSQMVLFTTGRGTPFSTAVPTVKISSNIRLYSNKSDWIDFNAGRVCEGASIEAMGKQLYDFALSVADGNKVKSELYGYKEIAFWKTGVTL